jgi:hypothetical protein
VNRIRPTRAQGSLAILGAVLSVAVGLSVALVALAVVWRRARRRITGHDRRAEKLVDYLAIWTRERDWQAAAAAGGMPSATSPAAAEAYREALREYSREAWRVRREHRALRATEGRVDRWLRSRRRTAWSTLALPPDCEALLDRWRELAAGDAAQPGLEMRLRTREPQRRAA